MDMGAAQALIDEGAAHWNADRFWDAHEAWERLWLASAGAERRWLQGLIQYAAALHHFQRGHVAGAFSRLLVAAAEKTDAYAGRTWGIDWPALHQGLRPWRAYGEKVALGAAFPAAPAPIPRIERR